jgi:hypothetical protein
MAMSSKRFLMIAVAAAALAGCNTWNRHIGDEDPFFGESAKYNAAVQTINPEPVYAEGATEPGSSGVKGTEAVKRYRTDKVKEVQTMQTTTITTGGPQ